MTNLEKQNLLKKLMAEDGVNYVDAPLFTIQDIRSWMNLETVEKGSCKCPACKTHIQTYKRTVSTSQAYWLAVLNKFSKGGKLYVDHKRVSHRLYELLRRTATDAQLLQYWSLVEVDPDKAGNYKITQKGVDFLAGTVMVNKHIHFTNGNAWKYSTEMISIADVKKFDISEITRTEIV